MVCALSWVVVEIGVWLGVAVIEKKLRVPVASERGLRARYRGEVQGEGEV